ncbi:protein stum-like [Lineus longissimus]|uniref:protein stum-like n=1 Tax=Lineus longissimus TaxID=88925 RepID=UPI002B4DD097
MMAGPQKENKVTRVKTAEKKGSLQKKESTKQVSGDQRVTKSPRSVNAIKKDTPDRTKVGKQGPVGGKEAEGISVEENQPVGDLPTGVNAKSDDNKDKSQRTNTSDAKVGGVKAVVTEPDSKQGHGGENTGDITPLVKVAPNKIKPVGSGEGTRKTTGNVTQKQKSPGPTQKPKVQIPRTDTQNTGRDPKTGTPGGVTQKVGPKATQPTSSGTLKPRATQQKPGAGLQKVAAGPKKPAAETKRGAGSATTAPKGTKFTAVSGKSTPQSAKRMETPTTAVGRMTTGETPPGNKVMKPEESEKSPRNTSVSSETSVAENEEDRRASKVSVASSKVSDTSLKLDLSSSSSGLPSFPGSAVGVRTPQSSATGSVSDSGYYKVPGIDITMSSDQDIKASEQNEADDKVFKENTADEAANDDKKQDSRDSAVETCENSVGTSVESSDKVDEKAPDGAQVKQDHGKVETDTNDMAKVESDQVNANVNSTANTNIPDDLMADNSAKQVIAVSDAKGNLVDGNIPVREPAKPAVVVPVHVVVPNDAKEETVIKEGKDTEEETVIKEGKETKGKSKEIRVVKEVTTKESKETKTKKDKKEPDAVKDSKPKDSKESDVKESKPKDSKDKDVSLANKRNSVTDLKTEIQEIKTPREKSWKNLFSRDSGKEAPGKAEKVKKKENNNKNPKGDKSQKKDTADSGKPGLGKGKGKSAWSRITTKDLLAGVHTNNMAGEGKQNGVAMTNNNELSRKESMSVLTVPNSNSLDDRQGKPDAKSLRSTGSRRLSVTSARRGSMESRRSVDIRGGLLNTIVVNPPGEDKPKSLVVSDESYIQSAIPILPLPVAILLFLLNIIIPGFGTVMSGFAIFCCGKTRVNSKSGDLKTITFCVNVWVGMAQLFTVTFCLVGWAWSIGWGIRMIGHSIHHRQEVKELREKTLQTMALSAFAGSPVRRMMGFAS